MPKAARELCSMADRIGLVFLAAETRSLHAVYRFKNGLGDILKITVSQGTAPLDRNTKGMLKRFARGQYHGLLVSKNSLH